MNHSHYGTVNGGSQQRFEYFRKLVISHKKAPQSLWKTAATVGGDAVYATTANKGHTEIVFMWKMENSAFQQKKTMVYFPHYFIGDTIAIPLILEKQGVRKIE